MTRLLRGEVAKLRTTQVWFWMLLASVAVCALIVIGTLASHNGVTTESDVAKMIATTNGALVTVFVLGVLGITTEFRYQTITPTVLQTPSRATIVTAKLMTYAAVGLVYAAVCIGVEVAITVPWLSSKHLTFDLGDADLRRALLGMLLVFILYTIFGIGFGALLRNQILAVTVGLVFLLVINPLIAAIPGVRTVYAYTPGGGVTEILFTHEAAHMDGVRLISPWAGVLVLLAWSLVPAVLGAVVTLNRDIT
jgi:ABC-2 type transport system permease protein